MKPFTKKDATKVADKLGAQRTQGAKHEKVYIEYNGSFVAAYNIRRGNTGQRHDYMPRQLHITRQQTFQLAKCTLSKESYFDLLNEQGLLDKET